MPALFRFLVALSYERHHSRTLVSIPKAIQLCDGLIASGQPPEAYGTSARGGRGCGFPAPKSLVPCCQVVSNGVINLRTIGLGID